MPWTDVSGVAIHYDVVGDGYPVVLHTGGGGGGRMWRDGGYVQGLDAFQCILLDHRGHGESDKPVGQDAHDIERYVDDVLSVLDALSIDRAAFWGYSAGGWVGYALASMYPHRVAGLITSGAIPAFDFDTLDVQQHYAAMADAVREHGLGPLVAQWGAEEGIVVPEWFMTAMETTNREMFALEVIGATTWSGPRSALDKIQCPVLMLVGELEDEEDPVTRGTDRLRHAHCITFPGLGHIGAFVHSGLALDHAVPFLEEIRAGSTSSG